jgi:magnesium chelatase accessory protein
MGAALVAADNVDRQVRCRPHDWHLIQRGSGPDIVLLHGTGASVHSWRPLIPHLEGLGRITALDLPGHGGTRLGTRLRSSLEAVAEDIQSLLEAEEIVPSLIVGHSAGAAVALRLAMRLHSPPRIVGINPALKPFSGAAGFMFPMAARMMAVTPGMVSTLAWQMRAPGAVLPLLRNTGSDIPASQMNAYARLFRDRDHVEGTLLMLAQWKLDGLVADLHRIAVPALFLTGSNDRMVPPVSAVEAAHAMPNARVDSIDGYGHLVHEEAPEIVARAIRDWL